MLQDCPFCGNATHRVYCRSISGTILECRACQGRFVQERLGEVRLDERPEISAAVTQEYLESYADAAGTELAIATNVIDFIIDAVGPPERVLEVGCGNAQIAGALRKRAPGASYTGIEISEGLFRNLDPARQAQIIHAPTLEEALSRLDDAAYDVVIMHHVLEHLPTPAADLRAIKGKIRPGGYIFIEVPNEQWKRQLIHLRRLLKGRRDDWFPGHINFFTRQTLARFVQSQGFGIVAAKLIPAADHPDLVIKMLGGPRAYRKNILSRAAMVLLRATRIESILGYGIVLRCIARNQ